MIRLRLMKEWFDHVTHQVSPVADQIARPWFDESAEVRCGPASSNIVCRVTVDGRRYYLRCNREDERTRETYEAEMDWVQHLGRNGVRVARPVGSKGGALVESVPTELGTFIAVVLEEAPGDEVALEDMDALMLNEWGATMAALHNASARYDGSARPSWRDHLALAKDLIPAEEEEAHAELAYVASALERLESNASSFGLIHFDMEADNMRWSDALPAIFDFDDCARYPFAADVAFALRDLHHDRIDQIDLQDARLLAFVEGYRSKRPLSQSELNFVPLFVRAHNLYWFARLQRSIQDGVIPGEKPWLTHLRMKLIDTMSRYRQDFQTHPIGNWLDKTM